MLKQSLSQKLLQKLSPQQIQFIKLLQVPTAELDTRIEEELEINPALEEGEEDEQQPEEKSETEDEEFDEPEPKNDDDVDLKDYLGDDDSIGYKMQSDGGGDERRHRAQH